jgi:hypothetical protein
MEKRQLFCLVSLPNEPLSAVIRSTGLSVLNQCRIGNKGRRQRDQSRCGCATRIQSASDEMFLAHFLYISEQCIQTARIALLAASLLFLHCMGLTSCILEDVEMNVQARRRDSGSDRCSMGNNEVTSILLKHLLLFPGSHF